MNKKWPFFFLFLVFALVAFYFYHKSSTAPQLQLIELELADTSGRSFDIQTLKGQKTLICFGASWCIDCRKELQSLVKLSANELKDIKIVVISDEAISKVKSYQNKYMYPFLFLKSTTSFSDLGIYSIPTNYLLNSKLEIVKEKVGDFNWNDLSTRQHLFTLMEN